MKAFLYMLSNLAVGTYDRAHTVRENQGGRDFEESRGKRSEIQENFSIVWKNICFLD